MQLLARPNNPNLICFRLPQPERALAKAVAGKTTPLKIAAVRLSLIPFPLSTDTCGLFVSVQDPFKAVSMATTILRTENLSDCGLGEGTTQAYSYMNFCMDFTYIHTYILLTDMHSLPPPPIPRLRLL